jgi:hypothetical protein
MSFRVKQIKFQPRLQDIGEGLSGQVDRGDLRLISGFSTWGLLLFCFVPSLGENLPSRFGGGLHRKTVSHGFAFMVEGRAPHARKRDLAYSGGLPPLAHALRAFVCPRWPVMSCLGMSMALPRGRGDRAPPRKNRPPHRPGSSP